MTPVIVDTDVVSFLFKNDSRAESYLPHLHDRQWLISFMTEAELEQVGASLELASEAD